jgi:hypothetical protein
MATITLTVDVTDTEQAILLNDLLSIDDCFKAQWMARKLTVGNVCNKSGLQS